MIQVISRGHTACHKQNLVLATGIWFLGNCCHSTFLLGIVRPRQGEEDFLWSANGTTFSSNDMLVKLSPLLAPDAYHGFKQHEWKPLQVGTVLGVSLGMLPRSPTPSLVAWSHLGLHPNFGSMFIWFVVPACLLVKSSFSDPARQTFCHRTSHLVAQSALPKVMPDVVAHGYTSDQGRGSS